MELSTGTIVSERYTVERCLGEGGMAVVYGVTHNDLGTPHALKVLTMNSRQVRERLLQEGRVQAKLRHKNIVAVTDVVNIDGNPGLVMELIDGPSLDDLLKNQRLTLDQADAIGRGVLAGIAHAHERGLIHRDLKPANIMLEIEGGEVTPKVMDFGLAKLMEGDGPARTRTGATMGTPQYMSPEQIKDAKNVDARSDVFACGAILYELVTGARAFDGDNLLEIFSVVAAVDYKDVRALRPDVPQRMVDAIEAALVGDVAQRVGSCRELFELWSGGEALRAASWASEPASLGFSQYDAMSGERAPSISPPSTPSQASMAPSTFVLGSGLFAAIAGVGVLAVLALIGVGWVIYAGPQTIFVPQPVVVGVEQAEDGGDPVELAEPIATHIPEVGSGAAPKPPTAVTGLDGEPWKADAPEPSPTPPSTLNPVDDQPTDAKPTDAKPTEDKPSEHVPPVLRESGTAALAKVPRRMRKGSVKSRVSAIKSACSERFATPHLFTLYRHDPDPAIRRAAVEGLMYQWKKHIGDPAAIEKVAVEVLNGGSFLMQKEVLPAYGSRGASLQPVVRFLKQPAVVLQLQAIKAIVKIARRQNLQDEARQILAEELAPGSDERVVEARDKAIERI